MKILNFDLGLMTEKSLEKDKFYVNEFYPLCIKKIESYDINNSYQILFQAVQTITDTYFYVTVMICPDNKNELKFLENNGIYWDNLIRNEKRLEYFKKVTAELNQDTLANTNGKLVYEKNNRYILKGFITKQTVIESIKEPRIEAKLVDFIFDDSAMVRMNLYFYTLINKLNSGPLIVNNANFKALHTEYIVEDSVVASTVRHNTYNDKINTNLYLRNVELLAESGNRYHITAISTNVPEYVNKEDKFIYYDQFKALYGQVSIIDNLIYDETNNKIIIILEKHSVADGSFEKIIALICNRNLEKYFH